jgi:hypothetical protein
VDKQGVTGGIEDNCQSLEDRRGFDAHNLLIGRDWQNDVCDAALCNPGSVLWLEFRYERARSKLARANFDGWKECVQDGLQLQAAEKCEILGLRHAAAVHLAWDHCSEI